MYLHHTSENYDMCSQVLGKQLKPQFPEHKSQTFTWCHVVCHAHTTAEHAATVCVPQGLVWRVRHDSAVQVQKDVANGALFGVAMQGCWVTPNKWSPSLPQPSSTQCRDVPSGCSVCPMCCPQLAGTRPHLATEYDHHTTVKETVACCVLG